MCFIRHSTTCKMLQLSVASVDRDCTLLITILFSQWLRYISSYLLQLELTHFYYFIFYNEARGLLPLASWVATLHLPPSAAIWCLFDSAYSIYLFQSGYILSCHRPKELYSLTNKSDTYTEGPPTSAGSFWPACPHSCWQVHLFCWGIPLRV